MINNQNYYIIKIYILWIADHLVWYFYPVQELETGHNSGSCSINSVCKLRGVRLVLPQLQFKFQSKDKNRRHV